MQKLSNEGRPGAGKAKGDKRWPTNGGVLGYLEPSSQAQARSPEGGRNAIGSPFFILPLPHTAVNIDVPEDRKSSGIRQVLCEGIATLAFQIRERAQVFKMLYTY